MILKPDLVLIDGSSYLFRAYHALPPLSNSQGEPTGAIVGVVNMLRKLIQEFAPPYMAVVFDAPGPTFRDQIAPDYKAQRPPTPDDLVVQIQPLHTIIHALGLPLLCVSGVEADDVIGTLATQAAQAGLTVLIATGDKDFAQLVTANITLLDTMTDRYLDVQGVHDKFGVHPTQMVDLLSLTGDKVDNIPGIPGCGIKTAQKWLTQYGDLKNLLAKADEITTKVGEALRANTGLLAINRELITIKCDVQLTQGPLDLKCTEPDVETLRHWYKKLEATRLLATLPSPLVEEGRVGGIGEGELFPPSQPFPTSGEGANYQLILDWPTFNIWHQKLSQAKLFAFDTETTSLNIVNAELVGISFAVESGQAAYLPLGHTVMGTPPQLNLNTVLAALKPILENPQQLKIGQNLKYDLNILARYGIELRGLAFDTMLESYILDATANRHDLETLAAKYLNHNTIKFEDVTGKGSKQITFDQVALEQACEYAAEDADITWQLHQILWPRLQQQSQLATLLQNLEMPLIPVLARMERIGVRINENLLKMQSQELGLKLAALETQVQNLAGYSFNLDSPKQISELLFDKLQLPVVEKTPGGKPSTAESVLERLAELGHELPQLLLEHRSLAKLKSTYLDPLPRLIDRHTGRVHTSYHQAATATGRLSSVNPNLQNIPIRTEYGRRIRQAFIAADGYTLLAADYSQIELRIMAHLSGDTGLLQAFATGKDVHRATAAEIFGIAPETVTSDQRRSAKAINFGLIYGMSAFGLSRQLTISNKEAQRYVDLYFQRYPGVKDFMEYTRSQAKTHGFVETIFGRRLYVPEINARNAQRRAAAERTAINAPMQGTAADIIKRAMLAIDAWLQKSKIPARMIMQIHDELVLEVRHDYLNEVRAHVIMLMESAAPLKVPLIVDTGVGDNWEVAH